jgi:hypothetical protein
MQIDLEHLRRQYSSLSDEALLAVKRADLVELARKCYDDELDRRKIKADGELSGAGDEPLWLGEAAEVYSRVDHSGTVHAKDVADVSSVLKAAGIPCYAQFAELPPVNGALWCQAISICGQRASLNAISITRNLKPTGKRIWKNSPTKRFYR